MSTSMNWDLSSYFPSFDGPEMKEFNAALRREIDGAVAMGRALKPLSADNQGEWEKLFLAYEELSMRFGHVYSYVNCLASGDAKNEAYSGEIGKLQKLGAEFSKLSVELDRALKPATEKDFTAFRGRPALKGAEYSLTRRFEEAKFTMSPEEEVLSAELSVNGISAWGRLYDKIAGKLEFEMTFPDGYKETRPMAQRRSLLDDADARVRKAALVGGNVAWERVEDVAAACLNHLSGVRLTLNQHRGVKHFLDVALFQSGISRPTLDAMFGAIHANIDVPRRVARLKASAMGQKGIGWQDLSAPLPLADVDRTEWTAAQMKVKGSFSAVYPELGDFLQMSYDKSWIEAEPRSGKRPGAYCTSSKLTRESRIFMTYNGSLGDMRTLAHEAGHAFHNWVMRDLRGYARSYPMTLAESASTFAEMILTEGLTSDPLLSKTQKANILNLELSEAISFLLDIPVRFEFEKAFYEERQNGELSVARMKQLMKETQRRVFGDVLNEGEEDSLFWASKLHFYISGVTFYNFPYTFGYLLSRGLFAELKKQGAEFLPKYREFLRTTGSDTAENVAKAALGVDLTKPDFWTAAIRSMEPQIAHMEELLPSVIPGMAKA